VTKDITHLQLTPTAVLQPAAVTFLHTQPQILIIVIPNTAVVIPIVAPILPLAQPPAAAVEVGPVLGGEGEAMILII